MLAKHCNECFVFRTGRMTGSQKTGISWVLPEHMCCYLSKIEVPLVYISQTFGIHVQFSVLCPLWHGTVEKYLCKLKVCDKLKDFLIYAGCPWSLYVIYWNYVEILCVCKTQLIMNISESVTAVLL